MNKLPRIILSLTIAVLAFSACKQDDDWQPPQPPTAKPAFGISGDTAVQVMRARSANASLLLSDSGAGQTVGLSISGLPPGVTAEIDPPIGTPPYHSTVRFSASVYAVAGSSSTATVLAKMADSTEKRHPLKVTVLENPSCAEIQAGVYTAYGCAVNGPPPTVTADSALPNTRIRFSGSSSATFKGYADLGCSDGTVEFPNQPFQYGGSFSGSGRYTSDTLIGWMTVVHPTGTTSCQFWFFRQ